MLYTQCRGCGEVFIIDAEHLTLAKGQVRCHVCGTVFDALQTLTAEQPLDGEDLLLHDDDHSNVADLDANQPELRDPILTD